jgi:hypothetical protein
MNPIETLNHNLKCYLPVLNPLSIDLDFMCRAIRLTNELIE